MAQLFQIEAYNSICKNDMACISETYSNSFISVEDRIQFDRYGLIKADHSSNTKRVGVCV